MTSLTVLRERTERARFRRLAQTDLTKAAAVDAKALADDLSKHLDGEVRFDAGTRAMYSTDGSNYRMVPIGVVIPKTVNDVVEAIAAARRHGAPVLSRGGGTSLAGQSCNVALMIDFSKYLHHVLEIDAERRIARVEPGCVLDTLRHEAVSKHWITFAPDPATHSHCTLGGMLGNNSCGIHSLLARKHGRGLRTSDNTASLEILTYDGLRMKVGPTSDDELAAIIREGGRRGEIYRSLKSLRDRYADEIRRRFPKLPRRVSGYNLDELLPENGFDVARALVGTESTCVTILEANLHLVPQQHKSALLVLGYPDVFHAADHVPELLDFDPIGLEGIDELLFRWVRDKGDKNANLALLPPGGGWLLVELGGETAQAADEQARSLMAWLSSRPNPPTMRLLDDPNEEAMVWKVRESSLGSTAWIPGRPDNWEGWEDSAVPVERVGEYLRELQRLFRKYEYETSLYGHFGQGCIHCRIPFDLYTREGIAKYEHFMEEATDAVLRHGGSLSGEHGDGQSRAQFLGKMFGPEILEAFREFKAIWDPDNRMNPGKVVDPYRITDNLRLGPDYHPPEPTTHFTYQADQRRFSRATLRCVGIGECRRESGGVMCPSYMVTREEKHSTRGRARLLFEMMSGEIVNDGWRSEEVKEALDLCLSCKGCKSDCPVNVDMATYKAEFLSHYYAGHLRPRHAYAFGLIHVWAGLAAKVPGLANLALKIPGLRALGKWVAGMAQERQPPEFAPQTFRAWWKQRPPVATTGPRIVLFPDTFTDHFHPEIAIDAVRVLEAANHQVVVPEMDLCCGRPLYDYGLVDVAKSWLAHLLDALREEVRAGTKVLVLEPGCASVFVDELPNLFPDDPEAAALAEQTRTFDQLLDEAGDGWSAPRLERRAILHGHCHHKALVGMRAEGAVLEKMGIQAESPEAGCCGMAGAFGFERGEHHRVSEALAERALRPAVRAADDEALVIADGFSCREQIRQGTDRTALHLAQVVALGLDAGPRGPGGRPEAKIVARRRRDARAAEVRALGWLAIGAGAIGLWLALRRRR